MPAADLESIGNTRAAERYLEQYGDPMVMNTYLKVTILVLAFVCAVLGALTFKSQNALTHLRPLIIRVSDVGHADAIDYRDYQELSTYAEWWAASPRLPTASSMTGTPSRSPVRLPLSVPLTLTRRRFKPKRERHRSAAPAASTRALADGSIRPR